MKKYLLHIIQVAILLFIFSGSLSAQITVPVIVTASVSNITSTSAISGGNITSDGGGAITARGVCWAVYTNPTLSDSKTSDGTGIGSFMSSIIGLLPSTTYHVRAYVTNCMGTAYGNDVTFTTVAGLPVVTTAPISGITQNSATTGGNALTYDVPLKGICWGTSPNPKVGIDNMAPAPSGGGSFVITISPLNANTTYYVRAYATNSYGTAYGKQLTVILPLNQPGPGITDRDNNAYSTVKIGNQAWMVQNLAVTQLNDGTNISNVTDNTAWAALTTPGYCWYNNDEATYKPTYGALYNWYAVNTGKLCPAGWHVPTDAEWHTLILYLDPAAILASPESSIAGGKLKETGTTHWSDPNTGATNESGFTALPGGNRGYDFTFKLIGNYGYWWSSTENSSQTVFSRLMDYGSAEVNRDIDDKEIGFSVRCVNDPPIATINGTTEVCQNAASTYITFTGISGTPPYIITYNINGGDDQTVPTPFNSATVSVPTGTVGQFQYSLVSVQDAYSTAAVTGNATVTVNPPNNIFLTSANNTQTLCVNTPITKITYSTTGATGVSISGLPAGVTSDFSCGVISITGTPTISGKFDYIVSPTGGCGTVTSSGSITVTPNNTITLTSAASTTSQTVCINTAITNITYATTGATGATFAGLPTGVTGASAAGVITISGTPTASGPVTYTITLTGGCGVVTTTGTITVTANNTVTRTSAAGTDAQTVCFGTAITNITYATTGATGATISGFPAGVTGNWAANMVTISGVPAISRDFYLYGDINRRLWNNDSYRNDDLLTASTYSYSNQ